MRSFSVLYDSFCSIGARFMRRPVRPTDHWIRCFRARFGVHPLICADMWSLMEKSDVLKPKYLFYGLHFLPATRAKTRMHLFFQVDEKTFRKYCWLVMEKLLMAQVVSTILYQFSSLTFLSSIGVTESQESRSLGTGHRWMVLIGASTSHNHFQRNGTGTKSNELHCDMKLLCL